MSGRHPAQPRPTTRSQPGSAATSLMHCTRARRHQHGCGHAPGHRSGRGGQATILIGAATSRLSDRGWQWVGHALLVGAVAQEFDIDLWTLPRAAEVIWRLTGVSYHPGHVWWRRRHHRSPQRPPCRAAERDDAEVARWQAEEWPRIKGGRPNEALY
jgi:hypothetical protein